MILILSEKITDWLIKCRAINPNDKDIYIYGSRICILTIITFVSILPIGIYLGAIVESIVFLFCFITLRSYAGGMHAPNEISCYIISILVTFFAIIFSEITNNFTPHIIGFILGVMGALLILYFSPIEDQNKPFNINEEKLYRKKTIHCLIIWIFTAFIFENMKCYRLADMVFISLFFIGFSVVVGFINNRFLKK